MYNSNAGSFLNGTICSACNTGTYSADGNSAIACSPCAIGTNTCISPGGAASWCNAAYFLNGTTCAGCVPGSYSSSVNNMTSCTVCPNGATRCNSPDGSATVWSVVL